MRSLLQKNVYKYTVYIIIGIHVNKNAVVAFRVVFACITKAQILDAQKNYHCAYQKRGT